MPKPNASAPRTTETVPTKSAIIGLLRSALGVQRGEEDRHDLANLRIVIRADREGRKKRDYQVAQRSHHGFNAGDNREIPKYHLQDATFTVLLTHDREDTIEALADALQSPHWAPFYGRRAHVPALPAYLGTVDTQNPRAFLESAPLFWGNPRSAQYETDRRVRIYDTENQDGEQTITHTNEPLIYDMQQKQYTANTLGFYYYDFTRNTEDTLGNTIDQYAAIKDYFKG